MAAGVTNLYWKNFLEALYPPPRGGCVVIIFLSFRASEARHGILYYQHVLDAGFHRHDDVDDFFTITTQPPAGDTKVTLV